MKIGVVLKLGVSKTFESVPDLYLIPHPDFIIQTAREDYPEVTLSNRENIWTKFLFDTFSDNVESPCADNVTNLLYSHQLFLTHPKSHQMAVQGYGFPKYTMGNEPRSLHISNFYSQRQAVFR